MAGKGSPTLVAPFECALFRTNIKMADDGQWTSDVNAVASEEYISSLMRRIDTLEKKLVGKSGFKEDQPSLLPTVNV